MVDVLMAALSGIFPKRARDFSGLFPLDVIFPERHYPGMSQVHPKTVLQRRLEERMMAAGEKPAPLATRLKLSDSFIRDILRGKTRSPRAESLEKLASALGTTSDYLLGKSDQAEVERGERTVPLVGYVGAGAAAHFYAAGDGNLGEVPAPEDATPETVAVEIRGESLGSLFDQWLVFYDEVRSPVTHDMIGRLCVVGLPYDRVLIKQIRPSKSPGLYHLLSNTEPPILDVEIVWAAKVKSMVPR
jgi:transcriptional regulator with XRE-family HTH domain